MINDADVSYILTIHIIKIIRISPSFNYVRVWTIRKSIFNDEKDSTELQPQILNITLLRFLMTTVCLTKATH